MPIDPAKRRPLGRTGLMATPLGFGGAPIGGLYRPVADDDAIAVVRRAWDLGIRLFDTAPLYGYGASERRVGAALADRPRDAFVLSTKVGRLVAEVGRIPPGAEIDRQVLDGREPLLDITRERVVHGQPEWNGTAHLQPPTLAVYLTNICDAARPARSSTGCGSTPSTTVAVRPRATAAAVGKLATTDGPSASGSLKNITTMTRR